MEGATNIEPQIGEMQPEPTILDSAEGRRPHLCTGNHAGSPGMTTEPSNLVHSPRKQPCAKARTKQSPEWLVSWLELEHPKMSNNHYGHKSSIIVSSKGSPVGAQLVLCLRTGERENRSTPRFWNWSCWASLPGGGLGTSTELGSQEGTPLQMGPSILFARTVK